MSRVAIIDMGTNTFNLLVVDVPHTGGYEILHSDKISVKLGEGGINQKLITPQAFQRGLDAVDAHKQTAVQYGAEHIYAFATSATRNATNGLEFTNQIDQLHNIEVQTIDGYKEMELIYYGVRQAVDFGHQNVLMVDIGGGSIEVMIGNSKDLLWGNSYELGISRLLQQFNPSDPMQKGEVLEVEQFFEKELVELKGIKERFNPQVLVGSSGSFDTFRCLLTHQGLALANNGISAELPLDLYFGLHRQLVLSTIKERERMPGMDPIRVDMIVLSSIFTNFMVRFFEINRLFQSSYALREGAIWNIVQSYP